MQSAPGPSASRYAAKAAAPRGVAACATAGGIRLKNAGPTSVIHVPARLLARCEAAAVDALGGGANAVASSKSSAVASALRTERRNSVLRAALRPGLPSTTTRSPIANVVGDQP